MNLKERTTEKMAAWDTLYPHPKKGDRKIAKKMACEEAKMDIETGVEGQSREEILQQ